jgi:hypothetical protein
MLSGMGPVSPQMTTELPIPCYYAEVPGTHPDIVIPTMYILGAVMIQDT